MDNTSSVLVGELAKSNCCFDLIHLRRGGEGRRQGGGGYAVHCCTAMTNLAIQKAAMHYSETILQTSI